MVALLHTRYIHDILLFLWTLLFYDMVLWVLSMRIVLCCYPFHAGVCIFIWISKRMKNDFLASSFSLFNNQISRKFYRNVLPLRIVLFINKLNITKPLVMIIKWLLKFLRRILLQSVCTCLENIEIDPFIRYSYTRQYFYKSHSFHLVYHWEWLDTESVWIFVLMSLKAEKL